MSLTVTSTKVLALASQKQQLAFLHLNYVSKGTGFPDSDGPTITSHRFPSSRDASIAQPSPSFALEGANTSTIFLVSSCNILADVSMRRKQDPSDFLPNPRPRFSPLEVFLQSL